MTTTRDSAESKAVPLSSVPQGRKVRLAAVDCGRGLVARLTSMGLRTGAEFSVVKSGFGGPIVVAVGNARFALGLGMAHKMMVVPVAEN